MAKTIAVMNEKGGVGTTATTTTLAYLLSKRGKRTAWIDFDGQGHSSIIFGVKNPNQLEVTINTLIRKLIEDEPLPDPDSYIVKTACGVDLIPSNTQLFTLERNLCSVDFRERFLTRYVNTIKDSYQEYDQNWQSIAQRYDTVCCKQFLMEDNQALARAVIGACNLFWEGTQETSADDYVKHMDHDRLHDYGYTTAPDGDALTYIWEGRPAETAAYEIGKHIIRVKTADGFGAESPWAALMFLSWTKAAVAV